MKFFNSMLVFILFLTIVSCDKDKDSSSAASSQKDLFSLWTRTDNAFAVDLEGASFGTLFPMVFVLTTGEACICDSFIIGDQNSGNVSLSNCYYYGGGSGDPDCANLWENGGNPYTYSRSGDSLQICNVPSSCGTYF